MASSYLGLRLCSGSPCRRSSSSSASERRCFSRIETWGPQGQGVRGVKTMVKSVGDRQIPRLESYGRR
jgi:hypothetical protein